MNVLPFAQLKRSLVFWLGLAFICLLLLLALSRNLENSLQADWLLGDFSQTFYQAGLYLLRGENVYTSPYPRSYSTVVEFPPFNPIGILYLAAPLSVYPNILASSLRFLIELLLVSWLIFLCLRESQIHNFRNWLILLMAPWHWIGFLSGQWSSFVVLGYLAMYLGLRRLSPALTAVGLWLALGKPNISTLMVFITLVLAWRLGIFWQTNLRLLMLVAVTSLGQPSWPIDLAQLWLARLVNPTQELYFALVLPGHPWTQLTLLVFGAIFLMMLVFTQQIRKPTLWLWAVATCLSLASALHTFIYDWLVLVLPLAWLLSRPKGWLAVVGLFLYPLIYIIGPFSEIRWLSPALIPIVLCLVIGSSLRHANLASYRLLQR